MVQFKPIPLEKLCEVVGGELVVRSSSSGSVLQSLAEPQDADSTSVTFFISEAFASSWANCRAAAAVVSKSLWPKLSGTRPQVNVIVTDDAYLGLARLSKYIVDQNPDFDWSVPSQPDRTNAQVDPTARIAPSALLGSGVKVGARTVIHSGVTLGHGVIIGDDTLILPNVVVYPYCEVGSRVRVHSGVVIGADGFGYARGPKGSEKIYHLGKVRIGNDVEIGANSTVDRGTIRDTIVENGAKIDNLVQIGHNGHIKAHAILCAQVGLAGNVTIGQAAILAGKAGIADKLVVGDGAIIGPMTGLSKDVEPGAVMMGHHVGKERRQWWRLLAYFDRLPELFERVKKLEKKNT